MAIKILDTEKFTTNLRKVVTAKTFTRKDDEMVPNAGSFYDSSIFGFSSREIFNKFGYLELQEPVFHPLIYKNIGKLGGNINKCLSKNGTFIVRQGMLEEDPGGSNGVAFLINNFSKLDLNKYKNEKNKKLIEFFKTTDKRLFIITKVPVVPIGYRNYTTTHGMVEEDEITFIYKKLVNISEDRDWVKDLDTDAKNDFDKTIQDIYQTTSKKEYLQKYLNELYTYFIGKLEKKDGFFNGSLLGKRIDNVARFVINAQPDIPLDCCALPWQGLLVLFDVYVIAYLSRDTNEAVRKDLGIGEIYPDNIAEQLDYIYKNTEIYIKHYPEKEQVWIKILEDIFNENPELRIIAKRDPGWSPLSFWTFKPIILTGFTYQMIVPSFIYAPIGGDSFRTNTIIVDTDDENFYCTDNVTVCTNNKKTTKLSNSNYLEETISGIPTSNIKSNKSELFDKVMEKSGIKKMEW